MDWQRAIFEWAAHESGLTGTALLAVGLLYAFYGYRMIRYLVVLPCVGLASFGGLYVAELLRLPSVWVMLVLGLLAGGIGLKWPRVGVVFSSGGTWGLLAGYLMAQLGFGDQAVLGALITCGLMGLVLGLVSREPMAILFTTLQGAGLTIVGFVGLSSTILPTLGQTFRQMAGNNGLLVPLLIVMLTVTGYSYQASSRQGDIVSGLKDSPQS